MRTTSPRGLVLAALILCPAFALAQMQLGGPVSSFVFDSGSASLRPVVGLAGAAYLGDSILTGLDFASVAPNGKRGIAVKDGRAWFISEFSPLTLLPVAGAIEHPEKIIWSGDSSTAVLYSPSAGQLQSVDPLGSAGPVTDLSSLGAVAALAVDRTGEHIAAGMDVDGIYVIGPGTSPAPVAGATGKFSSLAFSTGGSRLYAAGPGSRRILQIEDGAVIGPFLDDSDDLAIPAALAVSASDKFLYVADAEKSTLRTYEISTRQAGDPIALDFVPVCLEPLGDRRLFRLNVPTAHTPLLIFDTRAGASVFFVPAGAVGEAQ